MKLSERLKRGWTPEEGYRPQDLSYENRILTIEAADEMFHAVTNMAIDGWLSDKYDLPDQQELTKTAVNYLKVRYS